MKKIIASVLALVSALALTGCTDDEISSSVPTEIIVSEPVESEESVVSYFPVTVCGVELSAAPKRVVSLSPAVTEILFEQGYGDTLCGRSDYCNYPETVAVLDAMGSTENPALDGIVSLKPDVVFTLSALSERDVYSLTTAGITVVQLDYPESMEEYSYLYRDIAAVYLGNEPTTGEKQTEKAIATGNSARTSLEGSAVTLGSFVYVTGKGTIAGATTFENAVLSLCGENLCVSEGYCATEVCAEIMPQYVVADDSLTDTQLYADENIASMLYGGAKLVRVSSEHFERPSARTSLVFEEITGQLSEQTE